MIVLPSRARARIARTDLIRPCPAACQGDGKFRPAFRGPWRRMSSIRATSHPLARPLLAADARGRRPPPRAGPRGAAVLPVRGRGTGGAGRRVALPSAAGPVPGGRAVAGIGAEAGARAALVQPRPEPGPGSRAVDARVVVRSPLRSGRDRGAPVVVPRAPPDALLGPPPDHLDRGGHRELARRV